MKELAIQYAEELKRGPALEGSRKHALTVRVTDETLMLLEAMAAETGKKRAEVAADVMAEGAENLALMFAHELEWDHDTVRDFFTHGSKKETGK